VKEGSKGRKGKSEPLLSLQEFKGQHKPLFALSHFPTPIHPTTSHCLWRKGVSKLPFLWIASTPFSFSTQPPLIVYGEKGLQSCLSCGLLPRLFFFFCKYILLGFFLFITEIEILS
jgi:hypothetical protein